MKVVNSLLVPFGFPKNIPATKENIKRWFFKEIPNPLKAYSVASSAASVLDILGLITLITGFFKGSSGAKKTGGLMLLLGLIGGGVTGAMNGTFSLLKDAFSGKSFSAGSEPYDMEEAIRDTTPAKQKDLNEEADEANRRRYQAVVRDLLDNNGRNITKEDGPHLIKVIKDPGHLAKLQAIQKYKDNSHGESFAISVLTLTAIRKLSNIGPEDKESVSTLIEILNDIKFRSVDEKVEAVIALGEIRDPNALETLERIASTKSHKVLEEEAKRAIAKIKEK